MVACQTVRFSSVAQSFPTLRSHGLQHARLPCPSPTPGACQTHGHWVSDTIQPSHRLPSISPVLNLCQHQGLFKWDRSFHRGAKVLEFQLQHQSFQWILGLISFSIDWVVLLAVQRTLKSLLQHHSSKTSVIQRSAFFIVQLSYPYMTTEQTTALTRWTFHFGMKSISCPISKQSMLQPLSHHFAAPSLVNPEGTQDGDKECPPSGNQLLQPPARVHPEETQDEKAQDTGPR